MTTNKRIAKTVGGWLFLVALIGAFVVAFIVDNQHSTQLPKACWVEAKDDDSHERICGEVRKAPPGASHFSDSIPNEDDPAFDCLADGNRRCEP